MNEMKVLAIGENEYEVVDETARIDISALRNNVGKIENQLSKVYVNNVASMKQLNSLKIGDVIKTIGYYSSNDGGGATYLIREKVDTDVEDNGIIHFINDSLVAELMVENSTINVKQFGAKGDNETDDTQIFNNMINSKYNTFFIPEGLYRIENIIYLKTNMKMFGENLGTSILVQPTGRIMTNSNTIPYENIEFENITFRINGERTNTGITLNDVCYTKIQNCVVRSDTGINGNNGILIQSNGQTKCWDNLIKNCKFDRTALTFKDSTDNKIINNLLWATENIEDGALLFNGSNYNNQLIDGNHIIGGTKGGIYFFDNTVGKNMRIVNNYFDGQIVGINASQLINSTISNNLFYKQLESGTKVSKLTLCTINNNVFENNDRNDTNNSDIVITGNIGACSFNGNKHFKDEERSNKPSPFSIASISSSYSDSVVSQSQCSSGKYTSSPILEKLHYVNCYPSTVFTNE